MLLPWTFAGALFGAVGVMAGAFGAHALKTRLNANDLAIFETAVRYQIYHALALVAVDVVGWMARAHASADAQRWVKVAGSSFVVGTLIFAGTLYVLVLTGSRKLGMITPLGGLALIVGWLALALAAWKVHGR